MMDSFPILSYRFHDNELWIQACTHPSCQLGSSNATLETLGDLVVGVHVGAELFDQEPNITQGRLSILKSVNVDNESLARACMTSRLYRCLLHQIPDYSSIITDFWKEMQIYETHSNGRIVIPKFLADFVEAVVGAVFVDSGRDIVRTGTVINKLLGSLNLNEAHGRRPVSCLWTKMLKNDLSERVDRAANIYRCFIWYKNTLIAKATVKGSKDIKASENAVRNRAAFKAIGCLRNNYNLNV